MPTYSDHLSTWARKGLQLYSLSASSPYPSLIAISKKGELLMASTVGQVPEVISIDRETTITTLKPKLISGLGELIVNDVDKQDFLLMCARVEATVRAWYVREFQELMQLYVLFDPVAGRAKLEAQNLSPKQVETLEERCVTTVRDVMEKSGFKLLSDAEYAVSVRGKYLVDFPIAVDTTKLDMTLLTRYWQKHPQHALPSYAHQYLIFRRGVGVDRTKAFFTNEKIDMLLARALAKLLRAFRLRRPEPPLPIEVAALRKKSDKEDGEQMRIERVCFETLPITFRNLFSKSSIQEPTFERVVVLHRPATPPAFPSELGDRSIHVAHYHHIPMADLEIVLPAKKNPGLAPQDWIKFIVAIIGGLYAVYSSLEHEVSLAVVGTIGMAFLAYLSKVYATWQASISKYQNLLFHCMFDRHLDSGRGTLLNLCDEVIQQEVKEVITAYFVLMTQGKATEEELDRRCEELLLEEFKEEVDFEVHAAIMKLKKLGIARRDAAGYFTHQSLKAANDIIGVTTEELVALHDV